MYDNGSADYNYCQHCPLGKLRKKIGCNAWWMDGHQTTAYALSASVECHRHMGLVGHVSSNFRDMGTKCIWLPPTFATGCNLESRPDLLANLRGKGNRSMKGDGRNMGEAITGDWEETEDEKGGHRHPPHVRSPPTFQPWLHLCWMQCHAVTIYCIA